MLSGKADVPQRAGQGRKLVERPSELGHSLEQSRALQGSLSRFSPEGRSLLNQASRFRPNLQDVRSELLGWLARENREVLRLLAILYFSKSFGSHAALEQLAYRRCSARHPLCKTPRINDPQLCVCEHDLEPFASIEFTHLTPREKSTP
jgi:hypothetical protein